MGLRLNVDLDTNRGATKEAYIILETVRFNRVNTRVEYTTSFWLNKESAEAFQKKEITLLSEITIKKKINFFLNQKNYPLVKYFLLFNNYKCFYKLSRMY